MMFKIDMYQYQIGKEFLEDVDLICSNVFEYNLNKDIISEYIRFFFLYICIGFLFVYILVYMQIINCDILLIILYAKVFCLGIVLFKEVYVYIVYC